MRSHASASDPPWSSTRVSDRAWCQLCPNSSPMTLDGTNTWIVTEPGAGESIVIDPGPLDEAHLSAVLSHVHSIGSRVALTLLTHHHADHAEAAGRFGQLTQAPVRAAGSGHDDLGEGDLVRVGGLELLVVATPGHTGDSLSFLLPGEQRLFTGDTVLGRGTTVVAYPDGELAAYLASLERLGRLTRSGEVTTLSPGHGPTMTDAAGVVEFYLAHRTERLDQVRQAVVELSASSAQRSGDLADAVVARVYADVPSEVWPAARLSVLAQLDYLRST
ncbi:MAG: MBL fold metallo-hydrolase [Ornithinimicrobium sp.]